MRFAAERGPESGRRRSTLQPDRRPAHAGSIEMTSTATLAATSATIGRPNSPPLGDVVDMARRLNPIVLAFTGGERCSKRLPDSSRRQSRPVVRVLYIVTNGSLLTEARAEELFAAGSIRSRSRSLPGRARTTSASCRGSATSLRAHPTHLRRRSRRVVQHGHHARQPRPDRAHRPSACTMGAGVSYTATRIQTATGSILLADSCANWRPSSPISDAQEARRQHHELALLHRPHHALLHRDRGHPRLQGRQRLRAADPRRTGAAMRRLRAVRALLRVSGHGADALHALLVRLPRRIRSLLHARTRRRVHAEDLREGGRVRNLAMIVWAAAASSPAARRRTGARTPQVPPLRWTRPRQSGEPGLADRRRRWGRPVHERVGWCPPSAAPPFQIVNYLSGTTSSTAIQVPSRCIRGASGPPSAVTAWRIQVRGIVAGSATAAHRVRAPRTWTGAPLRLSGAMTATGYDHLALSLDIVAGRSAWPAFRLQYTERPTRGLLRLGPQPCG